MKIKTTEIFNKWSYWISGVEVMKHDVTMEYNGKTYEVAALNRANATISYRDGEKIFTIPAAEVEYIEMLGNIEVPE